tara:strand:- start:32 stop:175 length:144 start_codon:yes stop_codon:yes gene_type:complete
MSFDYKYNRPNIVAEIGCNHMGDMVIAKELIDLVEQDKNRLGNESYD